MTIRFVGRNVAWSRGDSLTAEELLSYIQHQLIDTDFDINSFKTLHSAVNDKNSVLFTTFYDTHYDTAMLALEDTVDGAESPLASFLDTGGVNCRSCKSKHSFKSTPVTNKFSLLLWQDYLAKRITANNESFRQVVRWPMRLVDACEAIGDENAFSTITQKVTVLLDAGQQLVSDGEFAMKHLLFVEDPTFALTQFTKVFSLYGPEEKRLEYLFTVADAGALLRSRATLYAAYGAAKLVFENGKIGNLRHFGFDYFSLTKFCAELADVTKNNLETQRLTQHPEYAATYKMICQISKNLARMQDPSTIAKGDLFNQPNALHNKPFGLP